MLPEAQQDLVPLEFSILATRPEYVCSDVEGRVSKEI
jgi:hypothetical protein